MLTLICSVVIGVLLSFLIEYTGLVPRSAVSLKRPFSCYLLHVLSWLTLYFIFMTLFQRPWFSASLAIFFQLLLLSVNFAKYHSLREPFLVQDFEYFLDLIKHPRLYLPFFGIWNAVAAMFGFLIFFIGVLWLEVPLLGDYSVPLVLLLGVASLISFLCTKQLALYLLVQPSLQPEEDLRQQGMFAFFWSYYAAFSRHESLQPNPQLETLSTKSHSGELPDLVVVQSESFFDPRQSYSAVRQDVLQEYDRVSGESIQYGMLSVPAWGANTVRTECAFLTGLTPENLGIYQFNPYWYLAKNNLLTLVSVLKQKGYQTVCVHPYPASFYLRDKVFPRLGFDRFVDITVFREGQKDGQYIGDKAVADYASSLLEEPSESPLFVFVITMENHGPLHLESAEGLKLADYYKELPPQGCDDLTVYLRHLKNADAMLKSLTETLSGRERNSVLCWYGDHVPVMSGVYKRLGEPVPTPPYLIWSSQYSGEAVIADIDVSTLPEVLLQQVSLLSGESGKD